MDMDDSVKLTPMMLQYRAAKAEIPSDAVLFVRLGDFYEMFFEDAERASAIADLTLTKRAGVPMCGFPYHVLDVQLPKFMAKGVKVAIADQMEDPKLAKGIVKRQITRIITPGTIIDNSGLKPEQNNFLIALAAGKNRYGLAALDISTGEFKVTELESLDKVEIELAKSGARECLISESLESHFLSDAGAKPKTNEILWTVMDDWIFSFDSASELLLKHFQVATLDGFGCKNAPLAIAAAGAVLSYATENLRQDASHVNKLKYYNPNGFLELDVITQRNLELLEPIFTGSKKSYALIDVIDETVSPMGGRMIRDWLLRPLCDVTAIRRRLDAVEALHDDPMTLAEIRELIGSVRDLERIVARLNLGSANARDLLALANGLALCPGIKTLLSCFDSPNINEINSELLDLPELCEKIKNTISEDPPLAMNDGGIIKNGCNSLLDELRSAATDGKKWLTDIQLREQERSGIKSLKVRFNQVFGYYIEISKSNLANVPADYIRKQTLVNAERFITPELKELESKILGAEEKAKALELQIFQELRTFTLQYTAKIQQCAEAAAKLDAHCSLAECSRRYGYVRPSITDENILDIKGGRHPVIDYHIKSEFVPNDLLLDGDLNRMMIITGPNMAGKSTYIRQTALLVIMAQMGSFIPADSATIGLVDRIFTRVGAADDISRGQSTFMVEMIETANILNHVTPRSLVILDEIGRGTSTFDGLSIAWSVAEYLHDTPTAGCRTQFATHYHEITQLASLKRGINNYNVAVKEYGDEIIFLRQIVPGGTDKSYGIHVAKLAGLPSPVIDRANEILEILENNASRENMDIAHAAASGKKRRRKLIRMNDSGEKNTYGAVAAKPRGSKLNSSSGSEDELYQPGLF